MKVVKLEPKILAFCRMCEAEIPARSAMPAFKNIENEHFCCFHCVQALTRAFIKDALGVDDDE